MSSKSLLSVGSRVVVGTTSKKGVVMYIGETHFSSGEWLGVKLDLPEGKNNGSVGDCTYFECEANHGVFVKRAQVKLDKDAGESSKASNTSTTTTSTRLSLSTRRESGGGPGTPSSSATSTKPTFSDRKSLLSSPVSRKATVAPPAVDSMIVGPSSTRVDSSVEDIKEPEPPQPELQAEIEKPQIPEIPSVPLEQFRELEQRLDQQQARCSAEEQEREAASKESSLRILRLEAQISELTDNVEMLTLDKEQFALENEMLQESLEALRASSSASQPSPGKAESSTGGSSAALATALSELQAQRLEVQRLRQANSGLLETVQELQQAVDSTSSYEEMIESLTEKNSELEAKVAELQSAVSDLEAAQELSDELDFNQREEMNHQRKAMDRLEATLSERSAELARERLQAQETLALVDRLKRVCEEFKEDLSQKNEQLFLGREQLKEADQRLRELRASSQDQQGFGADLGSLWTRCSRAGLQARVLRDLLTKYELVYQGESAQLWQTDTELRELAAREASALSFVYVSSWLLEYCQRSGPSLASGPARRFFVLIHQCYAEAGARIRARDQTLVEQTRQVFEEILGRLSLGPEALAASFSSALLELVDKLHGLEEFEDEDAMRHRLFAWLSSARVLASPLVARLLAAIRSLSPGEVLVLASSPSVVQALLTSLEQLLLEDQDEAESLRLLRAAVDSSEGSWSLEVRLGLDEHAAELERRIRQSFALIYEPRLVAHRETLRAHEIASLQVSQWKEQVRSLEDEGRRRGQELKFSQLLVQELEKLLRDHSISVAAPTPVPVAIGSREDMEVARLREALSSLQTRADSLDKENRQLARSTDRTSGSGLAGEWSAAVEYYRKVARHWRWLTARRSSLWLRPMPPLARKHPQLRNEAQELVAKKEHLLDSLYQSTRRMKAGTRVLQL